MGNFVGTIVSRTIAGPQATGEDPGDSIFIAVQSERGLEDTVHEFTSYARFRQIFGGADGTVLSATSTRITEADEALRILYSQGRARKRCYAVRVVNSSAVQAYATLVDDASADTLSVHAKGSGTWANAYEVTVSPATVNGYIPIASYVAQTVHANATALQAAFPAASNDEKYGWATLSGVTTLYLSDGASWVSEGKIPAQVASFKLEVKAVSGGPVLETFDNMTLTDASLAVVDAQSDYIYLENEDSGTASPFNIPTGGDFLLGVTQAGVDGNTPAEADIVGTDDGLGAKTGLKVFRDKLYGRGFLFAPGLDSDDLVRAEMAAQFELFNRVPLLGAPANQTVTTVKADVPDMLGGYYWPLPIVEDAITEELKPISPVPYVLGRWLEFLAADDYGKHPAGPDFKVTGPMESQSNGAALVDEAIAQGLVAVGINPVYDNGAGIQVRGARTCSKDANWRYLHAIWAYCVLADGVQRFLDTRIYDTASAPSFFEDLEESLRLLAAGLNSKGMFDGTTPASREVEDFVVHGFGVQANRDLLTPADLASNTIRVKLWFKDSLTAETIRAEIAKRAPTA